MPSYTLNVNGRDQQVTVSSSGMPLLWVLRDVLGLTGTKYGCGIEICGACTVWVNGEPKKSCDIDVSSAVGKRITTIEGLSAERSHPAQKAWVLHQVPQCGYCQSGMLMSVAGAMNAGHHGASIASEVNNLCVCGTYQRIKTAVAGL
ncbi:(2Fe-2S)-binding protein [Roseateles puraquae]|uniref:(2Fe-2S)-binding protein n=1 Tax=Roseateles puraquae TaxID=431059 RepID=A0A254NBP6_9BURK|nr:(2Fe-2S)-binding protein [Roseateles puraquae]MDG0852677.1 (2Fe-2S)-binding protein [Roseateles puraquae]OWR05389.1 (2Fe-2S)-binding protein [Roseateles puraquae]